MMTHAHTQAKLMDKRPLPIYIEARYLKEDFGKIIAIKERTRCTRNYVIEWANRTTSTVRGAAIRPNWIAHIFKDAQALRILQEEFQVQRRMGEYFA